MSSRVGVGVRGPRRTRVYDCNYNMGESYYKPVLDRMDRKYSGRPEVPEPRIRSVFDDPDFSLPPPMEDVFDSRGARATRGRPLHTAIDDDFDDEVAASLKRIRATKKSSRFAEDLDMDSSFDNRNRLSDKILDSVGLTSSSVQEIRSRRLDDDFDKRSSRKAKDEDSSFTRWTAVKSTVSSEEEGGGAAQRAKATRARLSDLEDEMQERSERTAAREQRAARLRALVAESDSADVTSSMSMRAEKKQVSF